MIEAIDAKGCTFETSIVLSAPRLIILGLVRNQFELKADTPNIDLGLITTAMIIDTIIYQPSIPDSCNNFLNPELTFTESGV